VGSKVRPVTWEEDGQLAGRGPRTLPLASSGSMRFEDDPAPPPAPPATMAGSNSSNSNGNSWSHAAMPLQVILTEGQVVNVELSMAGLSSTEAVLQAAFDACAEAVGMELEASDSKQIVLRYTTPSGREKKLNTKVPFDELKGANSLVIKLQAASGSKQHAKGGLTGHSILE